MFVYVCMWQMVGDIGGSIGFRWFWVAESAKVSCQLPLCTQESGWHCDRSSRKQALSHMLCLTLGSRSNLPRVGRSQISKGRKEKLWTWTKRISSQYFRGYLRSGPKMSIVYLSCCFPAGFLVAWHFKNLRSQETSVKAFFWNIIRLMCSANMSVQWDCCHGIKYEPNGKSKSLHGTHAQTCLLNASKSLSLI